MLKLGIVTTAVALALAPTAAAGGPDEHANQNATVKVCQNVKAQMGARNFNAAFAPLTRSPRAALRNCSRREAAAMQQARMNAAKTCAAWKADSALFAAAVAGTPNQGKTFEQVYGTGANAYGKCVSSVARARNQARRAAFVNAAKTCRSWMNDPAAFTAAMAGTANAGKTFAQVFGEGRNAYGKCVSSVASSRND